MTEMIAKKRKEIDCIPINFRSLIIEKFNPTKSKPLPKPCSELNRVMEKHILQLFYSKDVSGGCPNECSTMNYYGEIMTSKDPLIGKRAIALWYWFATDKIEVHKEYLIYDFGGLVGFVGGTLGLFIGFSFFDFLRWLLFTFKRVYQYTTKNV